MKTPTLIGKLSSVIFAIILTIITTVSANAAELLDEYNAFIGERDLYNSSGTRLKQPWQIIRQDRANFYRFGVRDDQDEADSFFSSETNRVAAERMIRSGTISPSAGRSIVEGNVLIRVQIYGTNGYGLYLDIDIYDDRPILTPVNPNSVQTLGNVPVMIGGEAEFDACGGVGEIIGLDPNGDNYLSVRALPSSTGKEIDRLPNGSQMYLCDEQQDWLGIVYPIGDCGVMTPVARRQPYSGVCKSGWVSKRYVILIAG